MTENTNETTTQTPTPEPTTTTTAQNPITRALGELVNTGISWAQYGLTMGQQSLQATARTLENTSSMLGALATRIQPPKTDE